MMKPIIVGVLIGLIITSLGFVEARTVAPFIFELPDDPENYFTPESVNNSGPPELVLQKSDAISFPLIIRSTTDSAVQVKFFATFGEQTKAPQLPPGIQVTIEPESFTLDKDESVTMNIQIKSTNDTPNGWYFLNFVGIWNNDEFSGTGISLKVGEGSDVPLNPADFIESPLKQFKSGIPSQHVSCKDGLELLLKMSNGHPVCVKPSTKSKLLQIGWAEPVIIVEDGWIDRSNAECENSPWNCSQPIPDDLVDCDQIDELKMETWHCPAISAQQKFDMLKIEGFTTCEKNHNTYYILKAGQSGSFTYQTFRGIDDNDPPIEPDKIEITKEPSFLCEYYDDQFSTRKSCTPDGIHVDFESDSPTLGYNQTVTVKATISADESAKNQSFWLGLTPYTCFGGSYEKFATIKSDNQDSHRREITMLSIFPKNVTLPEPKNQTSKTKCNADGVCFTPE